jgi:hypothetical protein
VKRSAMCSAFQMIAFERRIDCFSDGSPRGFGHFRRCEEEF